MKNINLISLVSAQINLSSDVFRSYLEHFETEIKESEIEDLKLLLKELLSLKIDLKSLDSFFVGYKINQINKEFDLLRIGKNKVINIELKRKNTGDKILEQLRRNRYYLSFLNKEILNFTYVAEENKLYQLDNDECILEADFKFLISELRVQELIEVKNIHDFFDPSNYLVSPFNSTGRFLENKYFLTEHQETFKRDIVGLSTSSGPCFTAIEGRAGTGKTLLTYDIAKEYRNNSKKVLIFHCGALNKGHIILKDNHSWEIDVIGNYLNYNFNKYDLIIIDETQRMKMGQAQIFLNLAKQSKTKYVFSYDFQQCLSSQEIRANIPQYVMSQVTPKHYKLTDKIRTNKEIASFIINLFDLSKRFPNQKYSNVSLSYFPTSNTVKKELALLKEQGWKIIVYTPSNKDTYPYDSYQDYTEDSAHKVIGQEFDKVVVVLDNYFYYDKNQKLSTGGWAVPPYYHPAKMLFQMVTRARRKLHIIVLNNEDILRVCMKILSSN